MVVDDLGWDDPAFMGNAWHETPAMDQLAAEGMVFTQAYSSAPNCKPSRASLLTGLYPVHHGIYSALPPNTPRMHRQRLIAPDTHFQLQRGTATIASLLKEHGYRTALIGKWDLGFDNTAPEAFGFDHAVGWFRGGYLKSGFFAPYGLPGLETAPEGEYLTTRLGDESARFIEASSTDNNRQPFFLMLSHYAVHVPLQAPEALVKTFRDKPRPGDGYNATYAAMLKSVDDTLAHILATLDAQGLRDNTIIILTSDNGAMAELAQPSALRGSKGSLDEGGIRIPLVWSGPGSSAGKNAASISHIDILPTLMAQLGINASVDGIDITACLANEACVLERSLYWHFPAYIMDPRFAEGFSASPAAAIRQGQWKLVENMEQRSFGLYDLNADPKEVIDVSSDHPAIAHHMAESLRAWQEHSLAPMPVANPDYDSLRGWAYWKDWLIARWDEYRARFGVWVLMRSSR